jgi:hypothetical protein
LGKVVEEEKRNILMYYMFTTGSHGENVKTLEEKNSEESGLHHNLCDSIKRMGGSLDIRLSSHE